MRIAGAVVYLGLANEFVRGMACLEHVECPTHIALRELKQSLFTVVCQFNTESSVDISKASQRGEKHTFRWQQH